MWIEKAHVFYKKDNERLNQGLFVLMEKTEAKWITYNNGLRATRKRKGSGKENEGEDSRAIDVDELEEQPRPMGQKKLKN